MNRGEGVSATEQELQWFRQKRRTFSASDHEDGGIASGNHVSWQLTASEGLEVAVEATCNTSAASMAAR